MSTDSYRPPLVTGEVRVAGIGTPAPGVLRVRIAGEPLTDYRPDRPAEAFRLLLPPPGADRVDFPHAGPDGLPQWHPDQQRPSLRGFTVRSVPEPGMIEFDVLLRSEPTWPMQVRIGQLLGVAGMRHGYAARAGTTRHLLIGDRSALPAVSAVVENLPAGSRCDVVLGVDDPAERDLLPTGDQVRVRWVPAGEAGSASVDALAGLSAADPVVAEHSHGYVVGEVHQVAAVHRYLTGQLGLPTEHVQPIVYWERGLPTDVRDPEIYRRYAAAARSGRDVSQPGLIAELELDAVLPD